MLKRGGGLSSRSLASSTRCASVLFSSHASFAPCHQQAPPSFIFESRRRYAAHARTKCFYDFLGVPKTATDAAIKTAYYEKAKIYHPDVNKEDPHAQKRFVELTEAYKVLSDKQRRRQYDLEQTSVPHYSTWSSGYGGVNGFNFTEDEDDDLYDEADNEVEYMVWESGMPFGGGKKKGGGNKGKWKHVSDEEILTQFFHQMGGFTFDKGYRQGSNSRVNQSRRESMYQQNEKRKRKENNTDKSAKGQGNNKKADNNHNNQRNNNNNNIHNSRNNNKHKNNNNDDGGGKRKKRGKAFKSYRIIIE